MRTHVFDLKQAGKLLRWGGWFTLTNMIVALLISTRYFAMVTMPESPMAWAYLITMPPGHMAMLAFIPFLLVFLPLSFLLPRALAKALLIAMATLGLTVLTIDTMVFAQYRFHLSPIYLDMIIKGGNQIISFSAQTWAMGIGAILILLLGEVTLGSLLWGRVDAISSRRNGFKIAMVIVTLLLSSNLIHIWADAHYDRSVTTLNRYYPLLYPATAKSFMAERGWVDHEAYRKDQMLKNSSSSGSLNYPLSALEMSPPEKELNVLILVLDSWRYDSMTPEITPGIHAFSKTATTAARHYSGGNATRIGIFSLFYGLPGSYWHAFQSNQKGPVLMDALLKEDYQTGIFASAPLNSPEFDRTVFADIKEFPMDTPGATTADRDIEITRRWISWLDTHEKRAADKKPFFGFLFLDSLHGYQAPKDAPRPFQPAWESVNYLLLNNDVDPTPFRNLYNNIALFQDTLVTQVLDDLKARDLIDTTVVVITGDHGQEFNDNKKNYWGHNGNFTEAQTRVPFILHWPGKAPANITQRTSHLDLAPTLMANLLGCTTPPEAYSSGRDLFANPVPTPPLTHLIMGSYSSFALYDFPKGRITVQKPGGLYDVYDKNYNEQSHDELDAPAVLGAMKEMSRFYR